MSLTARLHAIQRSLFVTDSVLRKVVSVGVIRLASGGAALALVVIQVMTLGARQFGTYSLYLTVATIGLVGSGSIQLSNTRFVAAGSLERGRAYRQTYAAAGGAGVVTILLAFGVAIFVDGSVEGNMGLIGLAGLVATSMALRAGFLGVVMGGQEVVRAAWLDATTILLQLVGVLLLYYGGDRGLTPAEVLSVGVFANVAGAVLAVGGGRVASLRPVAKGQRSIAIGRYRAITTAGNGIQMLTYRLDGVVLARYGTPVDLASYMLAVRLTDALAFIPNAVSLVVLPRFARRGAETDSWQEARKASVYVGGPTLIASLGLGLLAGRVFAAEFPQMLAICLILLPAFALVTSSSVLSTYIAGVESPAPLLWIACGVLALAVALYASLVPAYGSIGAASASAIAYVVSSGAVLRSFYGHRPVVLVRRDR